MLRKMIKGRKSWTMPDVRKSGDRMPLTKSGAMLQIVREERRIYDLESSRLQSHQGHDTRRAQNQKGAIGTSRGGDSATGLRNNSNVFQRSRSRPGAVSPWARTEEQVLSSTGSSYYHRAQQRELSGNRSEEPADNVRLWGQRQTRDSRRGEGAYYGGRRTEKGHRKRIRTDDQHFFSAWGPTV